MTATQGTVRQRRTERKAGNRAKHALVRFTPTEVKRLVVDRDLEAACAGLSAAVRGDGLPYCEHCGRNGRPAEWAIRTVFEMAGAIGAEQRVVVALVQQFGARDEAELRELVDQGRKLKRLSENAAGSHEEWLASSMRLLKFLLREHPEWRGRVMSELSSGVTEVSENGSEAATSDAYSGHNGQTTPGPAHTTRVRNTEAENGEKTHGAEEV